MKIICERDRCFGCRACVNACSQKAIKMCEDEEGFFYPVIDEELCIDCGRCKRVCPALKDHHNKERKEENLYAAIAADKYRERSSSGGVFPLLAYQVINEGGVVVGVAFDGGTEVKHVIVSSLHELDRIKGSKYVQSNTNTTFPQTKELLTRGQTVLFSGTPCQIAGLKSYLGKDYENLITIDIMCHGVPPQKIFDMYLRELHEGKFIHMDFRNKIRGWSDVLITSTTTYSDTVYTLLDHEDDFMTAFHKAMCLRPCCATCPFASPHREGDITVGDFWNIRIFDRKLDDGEGTSMVFLNTPKGVKLFHKIQPELQILKKVPLKFAIKHSNPTLSHPSISHPQRATFFRMISEGHTLKETVNYCKKNTYDCAILSWWPWGNYGGVLTAFALQEVIKAIGYSPVTINWIPDAERRSGINQWQYKGSFVERFVKKHFILSKSVYSFKDFEELNKLTQTFITGSDCMFHPQWALSRSAWYAHYLSFAHAESKKISYSTSFGQYRTKPELEELCRMKYFLQQYDKVSVREDEAVQYCKDNFGINAIQMPDPVLLIDRFQWERLTNDSFSPTGNSYVMLYNFSRSKKVKNFENYIINRMGDITTVRFHNRDRHNIEEWLTCIKNCRLLITHSFHGLCFALIFNKPFIVWQTPELDDSRAATLLRKLDLSNRLIIDIDTIASREDLFTPIDWNEVNKKLAEERYRGRLWLQEALTAPKDLNKVTPEQAMLRRLFEEIASRPSHSDQELVNKRSSCAWKVFIYKILSMLTISKTRRRKYADKLVKSENLMYLSKKRRRGQFPI